MPKYQSIILCANPRSGSTMLCDLMAATGVLGRPQSFYRPESISEWAKLLGFDDEPANRSIEFESNYLAAIRKHGADASGMFSLRLMWDTKDGLIERLSPLFHAQKRDADLFESAFGHSLYIHLVREDKIAQAVSLVRAEQSGQWHLSADGTVRQGTKEPLPVTYDAQAIEKEIASLTRDDAEWRTWFAAYGLSPLQVTYEDLARDPQTVIAEILEALGHDPAISQNIEPATAKMADQESRQWIDRYREETC